MDFKFSSNMLLLSIILSVLCGGGTLPTAELKQLINEGEMAMNSGAFISLIVPGIQSTHTGLDSDTLGELDKEIEALRILMDYYAKGYSDKGLTFNIYDDTMRKAAISLFHYFQNFDEKSIRPYKLWSQLDKKLNEDLLDYAMRLATLYSYKFDIEMQPPFITKPNYFVNSETISKAAQLIRENYLVLKDEEKPKQYYGTDDVIAINSNYSGWNSNSQNCGAELNYFREDIGLNSYYYGLHLLHPFWMTNAELDEFDPRHAERYYFAHQQLMARYLLENEHLYKDDATFTKNCQDIYNPQLVYDNGLPFPTRLRSKMVLNDGRAYLTTLDIAMKECISRGFIFMNNTTVNLTEDNHTDILARLVRANFDGEKAAKIARALYGYGGELQLMNEYNPTPSVLHHPQTTLRDPSYWSLIQYIMNYFIQYKKSLAPLNLKSFETDDFTIGKADIPNLSTLYSFNEFDIGKALRSENKSPLIFTARQRRINHSPFAFKFEVESKVEKDVIVRLFIGPQCDVDCWDHYTKFYELDNFIYRLGTGANKINWSPSRSFRLSGDYFDNAKRGIQNKNKYSMFKFPENLILPKGTEKGLNLTLFIMVTPDDELTVLGNDPENHFYQTIPINFDNKPFGFPFHRPAVGFNPDCPNYRLFNITIYHKPTTKDRSGQFSATSITP